MPERRDYYCYALFDHAGIPRWIGKGRGDRIDHHEWRICKVNQPKNAFIARTKARLGEIPKIIIRGGLTEREAFDTEIALIHAIGRRPHGPLVNMTDGGDGCSLPPDVLVRRGAAIRLGLAKLGAQRRSAIARDRTAKKTADQLSASALKAAQTQTAEQRSDKARRAWMARSESERRDNIRKMVASQRHLPRIS